VTFPSALPQSALSARPIAELQGFPAANWHLKAYPFVAPRAGEGAVLHYEGTFDPLGPHHWDILSAGMKLGFERAVLGICHQNPLKPKSTPFEHRAEIGRLWCREHGVSLAERLGDPGVYIEEDPHLFQYHKVVGFYSPQRYLLMGPDTFEVYFNNNVPWTHVPDIRENPQGREDFGFQSMYRRIPGFAARVLVYPMMHDIHATQIRTDFESVAHPRPVAAYVGEHRLYPRVVTEQDTEQRNSPDAPAASGLAAPPRTGTLDRVQVGREVQAAVESAMGALFSPDQVAAARPALQRVLMNLDNSQLLHLKRVMEAPPRERILEAEPVGQNGDGGGLTVFSKECRPMGKLCDAVTEVLLRSEAAVDGADRLLELLSQDQPFILVGNYRAAMDVALLSFALRNSGLRGMAEQIVFVLPDNRLNGPFEEKVVGRSVSALHVAGLARCTLERGVDTEHVAAAMGKHVAKRLERGEFPVLFGETDSQTQQLSCFPNIAAASLDAMHSAGRLPDGMMVVPIASLGADAAFAGPRRGGVWGAEEVPYMLRVGEPAALKDLMQARPADDQGVLAHMLGLMVAELLPDGKRGAYALAAPDVLPRSIARDIEQARSSLAKLRGEFLGQQ
jgi:hypothetical protein